jgi:nitrite reductase/ring-hydroxylating ferredoxin subunit
MEKVSRLEFLKKLGFGGAALMAAICVAGAGTSSCKSDSASTSASTKDFTLDLNQSANADLKIVGKFMVVQDVVIACTAAGTYAAVTVICSHEGKKQVGYREPQKDFYCTAHGAVYDQQGKGKSGPSSGGLRVYNTSLTGNSLRIYS